jgi:alanine dehydrogenase
MPGAVPRTSTPALTNETLPYLMKIAAHGLEASVTEDAALAAGVNVHSGDVTNAAVAQSLGAEYKPLSV